MNIISLHKSPQSVKDMVIPIFTKIIFYLLLIILIQHTESLSKFLKFCTNDQYCQGEPGLVCIASICVCDPYYNGTSEKCEELRCSKKCFAKDKYSMCRNGSCVCNDGYELFPNGKCKKIIASVNKPCSYFIGCSHNERCVDSICRCDPDYHFDTITKKCQYFDCVTSQINCSTPYDPHRECSPVHRSCTCRLLSSPNNVSNLVPRQQNSFNGNKCYNKSYNGGLMFNGLSNRDKSNDDGYSDGVGGGSGGGKRSDGSGKSGKGGSGKAAAAAGGAGFGAGIGALCKMLCGKRKKKEDDNNIDNVDDNV